MTIERGIKETQESLKDLQLFLKGDPQMPEHYRGVPRTKRNLKIAESEIQRLERVLARYTAIKG